MKTDTFTQASEQYAAFGVDVEGALKTLAATPLSLHCWQGDDVGGFEKASALSGGGIQATGNYPGKARTLDELRADLDTALRLIPGKHRLNLHASYADLGGKKVERNEYTVDHFRSWIEWCQSRKMGMDFNPTFFAHPKADSGFTLSHADEGIRRFWVEHGIACRRIGSEIGRSLKSPSVVNVWIPDGFKDLPIDRKGHRERLRASLDEIFREALPSDQILDALEGKLFGIASEACVIGSHEFYLGYATQHQKVLCLDLGHYHPTESVADKVSSVLSFVPRILLHVSRGVRWDSDHVVLQDEATSQVMQELVRGGYLNRTHIGLDFFDASINRVAAWVIGTRSAQKCLLAALLEPTAKLRELEYAYDYTGRLAMLEEAKALPLGAVWDEFCRRQNAPTGLAWLDEVRRHEKDVLANRK